MLFFVINGCKKEELYKQQKFVDVFDSFWRKMNTNYLYWDNDNANLDSMYSKYHSIFEKLDIDNIADKKKSISYFKELTENLIDGHYYVSFSPSGIQDSIIYPSYSRKVFNASFHDLFNYYKIDTNFLDKGFKISFDNNYSTNGVPLISMSGTINNNIHYLSFNHFSLRKAYFSAYSTDTKNVIDNFFSNIAQSSNIKGVIIDIRSNLGGNLEDLDFILGRFIDKPLLIGYTQTKNGPGKTDYTPFLKAWLQPNNGIKKRIPQIVVLADGVSASLAEIATIAIKKMPNSIFIGETTWGATGVVTEEAFYNAGSFSIKNFLSVQASSARFIDTDGKSYEGKGIVPDLNATFNLNELQSNYDRCLDVAIKFFK